MLLASQMLLQIIQFLSLHVAYLHAQHSMSACANKGQIAKLIGTPLVLYSAMSAMNALHERLQAKVHALVFHFHKAAGSTSQL